MTNDRGAPYSVYSVTAPGTVTSSALSRLRAIRATSAEPSDRAQVPVAPSGAKILPFPSRPAGTRHRIQMARDYSTDAVRDAEPCPKCQRTSWRLVSAGLWMDDGGHYWSPRRQVEKPDAGTAQPVEIERGSRR